MLVERFTASGTHREELMGVKATGNTLTPTMSASATS